MTFYDRYESVCNAKGIDPCSQKAADMIGTTRANISTWKAKGTTPKGETIALIADAYSVSTDFLLGRTTDPTDYSKVEVLANVSGPIMDMFNGDVKKALAFQRALDAEAGFTGNSRPRILDLYERLDDADQIRVEAYVEGMLTRYSAQPQGKKQVI